MLFDQYSRYKTCADLLQHAAYKKGDLVLDIGAGRECVLGGFIHEENTYYVDPLIPESSEDRKIIGDIHSSDLDGKTFSYTTAIDVYEHVPQEARRSFINRMSSLSTEALVLAFPSRENPHAAETDANLNQQYSEIYGHEYPGLNEHQQFGLPSLADTITTLEQLGWHCQTVSQGHVPWLQRLLGLTICGWQTHTPAIQDVLLNASAKFNEQLAKYDLSPPHYRDFIIATKSRLGQLSRIEKWPGEAAQTLFENIVTDTKDALQKKSMSQIYSDGQAKKMMEIHIQQLREELEESSLRLLEANKDSSLRLWEANKQLMAMSEWATGLANEKSKRDNILWRRLLARLKYVIARLRKMAGGTSVGKRIKRQLRKKNRAAFETEIADMRRSLVDSDGRLIIVFPIIDWDFRWQRPQHIVTKLRDQGYSILYLALTLSSLGRKYGDPHEALHNIEFNQLSENISQIRLESDRELNIYKDSFTEDDIYNITSGLELTVRSLSPTSIVYLVQFPGWWPVVRLLKEHLGGHVVFDCMDEHAGFSTNSQSSVSNEIDLIKHAELVITSSDALENKCKRYNSETIQVKNGTEFEHFYYAAGNGIFESSLDGPIIGYFGAISDWFDMEIVEYCAKMRPNWRFVLIGSTFGANSSRAGKMPNIEFLGETPYHDLPGYLADFSVCIIPFKLTPLTAATNPVKFYEYLSAGKPVVSTALPELEAYKNDCYLAADKEGFLEQISLALEEAGDEKKIQRRLDLARMNSWASRAQVIVDQISSIECT